MQPLLKWPGGKRWLTYNFSDFFPKTFNCYVEPFFGSGAIFFFLKPKRAILSDINPELINFYKQVKSNWKSLQNSLAYHHSKHNYDYYYNTRAKFPKWPYQQASRFLYLNRTCFNGIYRVNRDGVFNVPIGTKTNIILDTDDFRTASALLRNTCIVRSDFEPIIQKAKRGDFIFADPPYTVSHNNNGFIKYNERLFTWNDQIRLANCLIKAKKRGAKILLTNADHSAIANLYDNNGFRLTSVSRFSSIAAQGNQRKHYNELIITSY